MSLAMATTLAALGALWGAQRHHPGHDAHIILRQQRRVRAVKGPGRGEEGGLGIGRMPNCLQVDTYGLVEYVQWSECGMQQQEHD